MLTLVLVPVIENVPLAGPVVRLVAEDATSDGAGIVSDALEEGIDGAVSERPELAGSSSEEVELHEGPVEEKPGNGRPELGTFDDGKPKDTKLEDMDPVAVMLNDETGPLIQRIDGEELDGWAPGDVEFQIPFEDNKLEEGKLEDGKFDK